MKKHLIQRKNHLYETDCTDIKRSNNINLYYLVYSIIWFIFITLEHERGWEIWRGSHNMEREGISNGGTGIRKEGDYGGQNCL